MANHTIIWIFFVALGLFILGIVQKEGWLVFLAIAGGFTVLLFYICWDTEPKQKPSRYVSENTKEIVLARQGYKCAVPNCYERDYLQKHHKTPVAQGGPVDDPSNIVYLCPNHHAQAHDGQQQMRTVNYNKPIQVGHYGL